MWDRWWVVVIALAMVGAGTAAVVATTADKAEAESVGAADRLVMARPMIGDAGEYEITSQSGRSDGYETRTSYMSWNLSTVTWPDDTAQELVSLAQWTGYSPDGSRDDGGQADGPPLLGTMSPWLTEDRFESRTSWIAWAHAQHFTKLPGQPVGASTHGTWIHHVTFDDETRDERLTWERTTLYDQQEGCSGSWTGWLSGLPAAKAQDALEGCLADRVDDEAALEVSSSWEEDPDHGTVWVATVTITPEADEPALRATLTTSPATSLVLETRSERLGPEGTVMETVHRAKLVAWQDGQDPVPATPSTVPGMPSIPLVTYDAMGPLQGDLALAPLRDASQAIERTPDGLRFFQATDGPRILTATFVQSNPEGDDPRSGYSYNGATCEDQAYDPLPDDLPRELDRHGWNAMWTSPEEGYMFAQAEEPRVARDNPVGTDLPVQTASAWWLEADEAWGPFGQMPALEGPGLQALWDAGDRLEGTLDEGDRFISVHAPFTGDEDRPSQPLTGATGEIHCERDSQAGELSFDQVYVSFVDGEAASRVAISSHHVTSQGGPLGPLGAIPVAG